MKNALGNPNDNLIDMVGRTFNDSRNVDHNLRMYIPSFKSLYRRVWTCTRSEELAIKFSL